MCAWCAWCETHSLPPLPAAAADVVAFLAGERGRGISVNTLDLRRAAIRYLHFIAGLPVPTAEARVSETMAGIHREAAAQGQAPAQKLAPTIEILRQILAPIGDDPVGRRDRALLLIGFAGALRRAELAAIHVEHIEARDRGLRLTLPHSKGERAGKTVTVNRRPKKDLVLGATCAGSPQGDSRRGVPKMRLTQRRGGSCGPTGASREVRHVEIRSGY